MTIKLPELPYPKNALEPVISEKTLDFHHGKHHATYVTNLNKFIENTDLANSSLDEIVKKTAGDARKVSIFNNAAQVWNHNFYWNSMKPKGGGKPNGKLADKINSDFGSFEKFAEEFKNAATTQFGSGWAWLILESNGRLGITKTSNADTPFAHDKKCLLTIDVWEHAYYLDYQNRRPEYINVFLEKLVNWDFVASQI